MSVSRLAVAVVVAVAARVLLPSAALAQSGAEAWETPSARWLEAEPTPGNRPPTVRGYLEEMSWRTLPEEVLVIAGSSSARLWNEQKWFSDFRAVNRGFGGSRIDDNTHFVDELILPLKPSTVLFYAGTNDLWLGKPVDLTVQHFREFVDAVHRQRPDTQIVFVAVGPSLAREEKWAVMEEANRRIQAVIEGDPNLHYADIVPVTLDRDGNPRPELFVEDGLHLTELGYFEWSRVVKPVVRAAETRYRALKGCDLCGSQR